MIWIYAAALVFGGLFVVMMSASGVDFGPDIDVGDGDLDLSGAWDGGLSTGGGLGGAGLAGASVGDLGDLGDAAEGLGGPAELGESAPGSSGTAGPVGSFVATLLSFRSLVFFLAFFGLSGCLFTWLDRSVLVTFVVSVVFGLLAASVVARTVERLAQSEASSHRERQHLEGRPAVVVVPIEHDRKGRIRLDLAGQPTFLTARPYLDGEHFDSGDSVVVVEFSEGIALVGAMDHPSTGGMEKGTH